LYSWQEEGKDVPFFGLRIMSLAMKTRFKALKTGIPGAVFIPENIVHELMDLNKLPSCRRQWGQIPVIMSIGLLIVLVSQPAYTNIRAPRTEPSMPSSAPGPPSGDLQTTVLHEDLGFRCQNQTCRVTAAYTIHADRAAKVHLDFMLPAEAPVSVRIGQSPATVVVAKSDSLLKDLDKRFGFHQYFFLPDSFPLPPLYRATATLSLVAGRNKVTFEYVQPLASIEADYGYFKKGRKVRKIFYLLWPLKEWRRGRDFKIDLTIEIERPAPSWWQRAFGHPTDIGCMLDVAAQRVQAGTKFIYQSQIGGSFPDILDCRIGDDDLIPNQ
jgi:hypothetical protein